MLSIFAIVMSLVHFASAESQPDDVGRGVVLMLGFLVSAALFAPSIIVGHKSKEGVSPQYINFFYNSQKIKNAQQSIKSSPIHVSNSMRSTDKSAKMKQEELPLKISKSEPLEHQVYFEGRYEYGDPGWQYDNTNEPKILSKTSANI